ncbi:MAG: SIR2 family protein [Sandaracinaceae bacterium]|nr:SIR2 family protein [Sandaracinaceae bacterium]
MATREALIEACHREPITLFLGAGISHSRGVPLWHDVVRRMAEWVVGGDADGELLERARGAVRAALGEQVASRVMLKSHPLEPQLALEWMKAKLEDEEVRAGVAARIGGGDASFVGLLRRALYERVRRTGDGADALSAVASAVRVEHGRWPLRRLVRVITLNADDLLEREVCADGVERLTPIARPSRSPERGDPARPPPIPIYHVHGFLPEDAGAPEGSGRTLVFTDDELWSTTSHPLSFANRVVANALHDSQCVFAGLSMHDVNLMRWLAVRFEEVVRDASAHGDPDAVRRLHRHFWIHTADDDPTGIVSDVLALRGVRSVELASWRDRGFADLLRACFPPA